MDLELASLHGDFEGDPVIIATQNFYKSDLRDIKVQVNKCIENSYRFAMLHDCKIVEGVLLSIIDGLVDSIQPHCWNYFQSKYYDTTIDCLHSTELYNSMIGDKKEDLKYFKCVEYSPEESGYDSKCSTFYYNYDVLIGFIRTSLEQKNNK